MKSLYKSLAVAAMVLAPIAAHAQIGSVNLTLSGYPYQALNGGGFSTSSFVFTPNAGAPINFAQFVVWCIDNTRNVDPNGGNYTYSLYTLSGFAATGLGSGVPFNSDPDLDDMTRIASNLQGFQNQADNATWVSGAANNATQQSTWDIFNTGAAGGNGAFTGGGNWFILHNGRNQTLGVRFPDPNIVVPEPSTYAMMAMGLVGLAGFARRRRNNA